MDDKLHTNYLSLLPFEGYTCTTNALALLHVSLLFIDNLALTSILSIVFHLKNRANVAALFVLFAS